MMRCDRQRLCHLKQHRETFLMHVLIVEDDTALATNIGEYLEQQGDQPDFAGDGAIGLQLCQINAYDAVILDLRMPRVDGITFCQRLRTEMHSYLPVLMLTARDTVADRIEGFEAGSDDYLCKPFALREMYLRLQAIGRRGRRSGDTERLVAGMVEIDLKQRLIRCGDETVELTPIVFKMLEMLVRAFPGIVTRAQFEREIWNDEPPESDAALRGHVHRLRELLRQAAGAQVIRTIHGVGYQLVDPR